MTTLRAFLLLLWTMAKAITSIEIFPDRDRIAAEEFELNSAISHRQRQLRELSNLPSPHKISDPTARAAANEALKKWIENNP
jgi:hypothetical protein